MKPTSIALTAILALAVSGCQSAEQRQANELRQTLVRLTDEIEKLDQEEIVALRARKEVLDASPSSGLFFGVLREAAKSNLESAEKRLPERLAELRKQVEEYTDLELAALARRVRAEKNIAVARVQSAQERLQKDRRRKKEVR